MHDIASGARWWRLTVSATLTALLMALTACGGDDAASDANAAPAAAKASEDSGADGVGEAQKAIDALFAGESFEEPPADGPPPEPGKKVTVVVTGLAFAGSALFADA